MTAGKAQQPIRQSVRSALAPVRRRDSDECQPQGHNRRITFRRIFPKRAQDNGIHIAAQRALQSRSSATTLGVTGSSSQITRSTSISPGCRLEKAMRGMSG
jgi:hypothetical protein